MTALRNAVQNHPYYVAITSAAVTALTFTALTVSRASATYTADPLDAEGIQAMVTTGGSTIKEVWGAVWPVLIPLVLLVGLGFVIYHKTKGAMLGR